MKKYIGTKIIHAEPATGPSGDGYNVTYKDGYKSWSPKAAFEEAYIAVDDIPDSLTIEYIESCVVHSVYLRSQDGPLTICVLTLKNGYLVTGESACISMDNFNEQIGKDIARANAIEKVWMLEGYLLKQRRAEAGVM